MRLGGPTVKKFADPQSWVSAIKKYGYRAAYCPVGADADDKTIESYAASAHEADIIIAEAGAWSNPCSPDSEERGKALDICKSNLALADKIGACCCVNIAGSRGAKWDGPSDKDLTDETFDIIVETVREIIDSVNPVRTFYALETMPWMYPDSADSYLRLIKAIDRKQFAVHLDPVNLVNSPQRYFHSDVLLRECFAKLGPYLKSCHAKDIILHDNLTVHLDEVRPGLGRLDYTTFLREMNKLHPDMPLMLEHLDSEKEYLRAAEYVRSVAQQEKIEL